MKVKAIVPATAANLGPGFDCFGLALGLYNEVTVEFTGRPGFSVSFSGEGSSFLPHDQRNLIYRGLVEVFEWLGEPHPGFRISALNRIPVSRGLGSSAAAIVAGIVAADRFLGQRLSAPNKLALAAGIEGHPDNVAPALFGGLVLTYSVPDETRWEQLFIGPGLVPVVCIPDLYVPTAKARAVLPGSVSYTSAVHNLARSALLVHALSSGRYELLGEAMADALHQPFRARLVPGFVEAKSAALEAGAFGASLSGSGSTILALTSPEKAEVVGRAMVAVFRHRGTEARALALPVVTEGARTEVL
ncbi:MAG: homoserine kinase [Bacillota bacterium]